MGCYDTVRFKCPRCDEKIFVQNKARHCTLEYFDQGEVPAAIARGSCGGEWQIVEKPPKVETVALVLA